MSKKAVPAIADSVLPIVAAKRAEVVQSDHAVGDYVRLLPTPGHTPGHFSVLVGRRTTEEAVITGDLIHSPLQARYPELSMRFDFDRNSQPGPAAPSWSGSATPAPCAARRISLALGGPHRAVGRGLSLRPRGGVTYGMIFSENR